MYRFFLKNNEFGATFERIVRHCRALFREAETVLSFALGFYVSQISDRWWKIFMTIPWPDSTGLQMCALIRARGGEKHANSDRVVRRTMMRYMILCYVLVFRDISERIKRRFPTYNHLVPTLLTEAEKAKLEREDIKRAYWMPIEWVMQILRKCYARGQIDEYHLAVLSQIILKYREQMHNVLSFDWINVPLVYTQVVHICILAYFGIICFAHQPIREEGDQKTWIQDFVIPGYAIFEFIFFVGWLKVAQVMLNPFGMDEDDFEIDGLVERNLQVGYSYVDTMFDRLPPLVYVGVTTLPHTKASMELLPKATPMVGSVANVQVPRAEQRVISKEDVELIRKLVGPKFGRRDAYELVKRIKSSKSDKGSGKRNSKTKNDSSGDNKENPLKRINGGPTSDTQKVKAAQSNGILRQIKSLTTQNVVDIVTRIKAKASRSERVDETQTGSDFVKATPFSERSRMQSTQYSKLDSKRQTVGTPKTPHSVLPRGYQTPFQSKSRLSKQGYQTPLRTRNRTSKRSPYRKLAKLMEARSRGTQRARTQPLLHQQEKTVFMQSSRDDDHASKNLAQADSLEQNRSQLKLRARTLEKPRKSPPTSDSSSTAHLTKKKVFAQ